MTNDAGKTPNFARMSHEDRLKWMAGRVIDTEDVRKVDTACIRLWRQAGIEPEGSAGFVVGESGVGKSTAVAAFVDELFEREKAKRPDSKWQRPTVRGTPIRPIWEIRKETGYQRPLVVVVVNPNPKLNALMRDTARALGVSLGKGFDFGEAMVQINLQIEEQGIKMIVFDEVQHITEGTLDNRKAADVFKMMVKARLMVVCVGLTSALELVQDLGEKAEAPNEQLQRLKQKSVTLRPLPCSLNEFPPLDASGRPKKTIEHPETPYRNFCAALDDRSDPDGIILPFNKPSNISDPAIAIPLWKAFDGYIGKMVKFLFAVTDLAIEKGMSNLTLQVMAATYRDQTECPDANNWFMMKQKEIEDRFYRSAPKSSNKAESEPKRRQDVLGKKR